MLTYPAFLRPVGSFVPSVESGKAERPKEFSYFLAQKEAKTSTPDQTYPLYGTGLTENRGNRRFIRAFWYRGTRDDISMAHAPCILASRW